MSKKILLVEDDKDIINLVKHYLEKEGYGFIKNVKKEGKIIYA